MIGLMLGVAVLITVLSVMNGFDQELRTRILGMVPHATITEQGGMNDWKAVSKQVSEHPDVIGVAPFINAEGMLTHAGNVKGALITGIDPKHEPDVSIVANHIVEGELETIMAGLSCGEVSLLAWEVLKDITTAFISISDGSIAKTMHLLKNSEHSIISVILLHLVRIYVSSSILFQMT